MLKRMQTKSTDSKGNTVNSRQPHQSVRHNRRSLVQWIVAVQVLMGGMVGAANAGSEAIEPSHVFRRNIDINGVNVFYRESGVEHAGNGQPVLVLLHGFPTSSHMFREFIPRLSDRYRVIAPDFPGYGLSDAPPADEFEYSFDHLAAIVEQLLDAAGAERWVLYLQDYGAPVGFRLAVKYPERVAGLIIQNGNAYEEGLPDSFWGPWRDYWKDSTGKDAINYLASLLTLESTVWQFTHGTRQPDAISPDNWLTVQPLLDRPGNAFVQLELAYDYGTNLTRYPKWQAYLRKYQPPTLITWGRNDEIFPTSGALQYLRDLPNAELHLLDTGHFALEEDGDLIANLVRRWWEREIAQSASQR